MGLKRVLLETINKKLDLLILGQRAVERALADLQQGEKVMAGELQTLTDQVKANTDTEASAVLLLGQLSDLIKQAGTDPAKLAALTQQLDASKEALAAAIVANTPAAP